MSLNSKDTKPPKENALKTLVESEIQFQTFVKSRITSGNNTK